MSTNAYWWLALGLGLVAAVAVTALLHLFYRQVRRIEAGAQAVWSAGQEVAANTASTWMLGETVSALDTLAEEGQRHAALFSGADGGRR